GVLVDAVCGGRAVRLRQARRAASRSMRPARPPQTASTSRPTTRAGAWRRAQVSWVRRPNRTTRTGSASDRPTQATLRWSRTPAASITLSATATPTNKTRPITKVDFFRGTTLIGTGTSSPYSFNWTNVPAGTYSITAKATDSSGATATSAARSIKVDVPPTVG